MDPPLKVGRSRQAAVREVFGMLQATSQAQCMEICWMCSGEMACVVGPLAEPRCARSGGYDDGRPLSGDEDRHLFESL